MVTVRRLTFSMRSTSGIMNRIPGSRTLRSLPSRNTTPRSYCFTTATPSLDTVTTSCDPSTVGRAVAAAPESLVLPAPAAQRSLNRRAARRVPCGPAKGTTRPTVGQEAGAQSASFIPSCEETKPRRW